MWSDAKFINLSGLINEKMPKIIAAKVLNYSKNLKKKSLLWELHIKKM